MNKFKPTHRSRRDVLLTAVQLAAFACVSPIARADSHSLKIGTIGAGNVGRALGTVWVNKGHQVKFSSRNPDSLRSWVDDLGPSASVGTVEEAVAFGDVILLAVPYGALPDLAARFAPAMARKVPVMDTCNPFPNRDGDVAVEAIEKGAGRYIAELMPGAPVVRAFNAINYRRMAAGGRQSDGSLMGMPIAGDGAEALAVASALTRDVEYEPVIVGDLEFGKHLRPRQPLAGELEVDEIKRIAATLD